MISTCLTYNTTALLFQIFSLQLCLFLLVWSDLSGCCPSLTSRHSAVAHLSPAFILLYHVFPSISVLTKALVWQIGIGISLHFPPTPMIWMSIAGNKQIKYWLILSQITRFSSHPASRAELVICTWPPLLLMTFDSSTEYSQFSLRPFLWIVVLSPRSQQMPLLPPSKLKPSGLIKSASYHYLHFTYFSIYL